MSRLRGGSVARTGHQRSSRRSPDLSAPAAERETQCGTNQPAQKQVLGRSEEQLQRESYGSSSMPPVGYKALEYRVPGALQGPRRLLPLGHGVMDKKNARLA